MPPPVFAIARAFFAAHMLEQQSVPLFMQFCAAARARARRVLSARYFAARATARRSTLRTHFCFSRLTRALPASAAMLRRRHCATPFQLLFAFTLKDIFSYFAYAIMMPFFDAILIFRQMLLRHAFRCHFAAAADAAAMPPAPLITFLRLIR
jgi:hypothetical protein